MLLLFRAALGCALVSLVVPTFAAQPPADGVPPAVSPPRAAITDGQPQSLPLPGQNAISDLAVRAATDGRLILSFDSYYTGDRSAGPFRMRLAQRSDVAPAPAMNIPSDRVYVPSPGKQHIEMELQPPITQLGGFRSHLVIVEMLDASLEGVLARQEIVYDIDWPDRATYRLNRQIATLPPAQLLANAVAMIDSGNHDSARTLLQKLIARDPAIDGAYIELARVAMKTSWGPGGLHEAEGLLQAALQIAPESANARILLGYVYAHQQKYRESEALFELVARKPNDNLWLWANWGEVLAMQGKLDAAERQYRKAIAQSVTHDTYDHARRDAYHSLRLLIGHRGDLEGVDALYAQQIADYGLERCTSPEYARFLLQKRGDLARAAEMSERVLSVDCENYPARDTLALSQYAMWSRAGAEQKAALLNRARASLPPSPRALFLLAGSDVTLEALKALVRAGEPLDQTDNEGRTALMLALADDDIAAARRLLDAGARTDVGSAGGLPVALLPVVQGNPAGVRLMREHGVDYRKLNVGGMSALDIARSLGNLEVVSAMDGKAGAL